MDTAATGVGERRGDQGQDRAAVSPDLTGVHAAFVTTPPCRPPHHMISDVGLIGEGHVPMPGDLLLWPTMACSRGTQAQSAGVLS